MREKETNKIKVKINKEIARNAEEIEKDLGKPLIDYIKSDEFKRSLNLLKFFTAPTGAGKTYFLANQLAPELINNHNNDGLIYLCPTNDAKRSAFKDIKKAFKGTNVEVTTDVNVATSRFNEYKKFVLCLTNQAAVVTENINSKILKLEKNGKIAWFVDEIHQWTISSEDGQKICRGNESPNYAGGLYKMLNDISMTNLYVFGTTATPHAEHDRIQDTDGEMSYLQVNRGVAKKLLIFQQSWMKNASFFNPNNEESVVNTIDNALDDIYGFNSKNKKKKTLLIQCDIDTEKKNGLSWWIEDVRDLVLERMRVKGYVASNVYAVGSMTQDGNRTYSYDDRKGQTVKGNTPEENDDMMMDKMLNVNDPLRVLLVRYKGQSGININSLGAFVSLRQTERDNGLGGFVPHAMIQAMGRMLRIFKNQRMGTNRLGEGEMVDSDDLNYFTSSNDYNILESLLLATKKEREEIYEANSYSVYLADTSTNGLALDIFLNGRTEIIKGIKKVYPAYANTLDEVKAEVERIANDLGIK